MGPIRAALRTDSEFRRPTILGVSGTTLVASLVGLTLVGALVATGTELPHWLWAGSVSMAVLTSLFFIATAGREFIRRRIDRECEKIRSHTSDEIQTLRLLLGELAREQRELRTQVGNVHVNLVAAVNSLAYDLEKYGDRRASEATIAALNHASGGLNARGVAAVTPLRNRRDELPPAQRA